MAALAVLALLLAPRFFHPAPARASYNCVTNPNTNTGHCYGATEWYGGASGAYTSLSVVGIYDNDDGHDLTNEQWLIASADNAWVEAGYLASGGLVYYFWADQRPGSTFIRHLLTQVPSGDYGSNAGITIARDSGTQYHITISSAYYYNTGYSTDNSMNPDGIEIGEELSGYDTGYAPQADWTYNQWIDSGGSYYYQDRNPDNTSITNPPGAGWVVSPPNSTTGGDWVASCC